MVWKAPSADEISQDLRAAVKAELPESNPWIWPNNLYVVTKVLAQAMRAFYLRVEWLLAQIFVATADADMLDQHAADWGLSRNGATYATGDVTFTTVAGAEIPAGTRVSRADGEVFETTRTKRATSATTTAEVRALQPGSLGNTKPTLALDLLNALTDVSSPVVAAGGIRGGVDEENDNSLRSRILLRKQNPPHGGSPQEIVEWAREVSGVTRVYVKRAAPAAGSVTVVFFMDDAYPENSGVPTSADVEAVLAHLEASVPASADVIVKAPIAVPVNVTVQLTPNTGRVQDNVRDELQAMFRRRSDPGSTARPTRMAVSWISEAISAAAGERRHVLVAPTTDTILTEGAGGEPQVAVLGTLTFQ